MTDTIPMIMLAPSEHKLHDLFKKSKEEVNYMLSSLPETQGADILICTNYAWFWLQRKEVPHDFVQSAGDSRVGRSVIPLGRIKKGELPNIVRLIAEGEWKFHRDEMLNLGYVRGGKPLKTRWTRSSIQGLEFDIEYVAGVPIVRTHDIEETFRYITRLAAWASRATHQTLWTRPSLKGEWSIPTNNELHLWILQSWQGIGLGLAKSILDHFGDDLPLRFTCTPEELGNAPRMSYEKAKQLIESLHLTDVGDSTLGPMSPRVPKKKKSKTKVKEETPTSSNTSALLDRLASMKKRIGQ